MTAKLLLSVTGMTCDGCAQTVQSALEREEGVEGAAVSWEPGTAEIAYDPATIDEERILGSRIFRRQYRAEPVA
ncbi:MAG: cation transporter, partial [Dehalococcoidia bacterium]